MASEDGQTATPPAPAAEEPKRPSQLDARVYSLETATEDFAAKTNGALLAIEGRVHKLEDAHLTPGAPGPEPDPSRPPYVGELVFYRGDESNGSDVHPALVTKVTDADTVNVTVFFDGSGPAARKDQKRSKGEWAFDPSLFPPKAPKAE